MTWLKFSTLAALVLITAGCADNKPDYDGMAKCEGLGYKPGTAEYDKCVREEKSVKMMEEQRREFEKMKQDDRDRKLRGY